MNKTYNVTLSERGACFFVSEFSGNIPIQHIIELKRVAINFCVSTPFLYFTLADETLADRKYIEQVIKFLEKKGFAKEAVKIH